MVYLKYLALAIANILFYVLAMLLAPVLPLFALGVPHLPTWLSWFDTPDNPLDGDAPFQSPQGGSLFSGTVTGIKQYVNRVIWLWRNPGYNFDFKVLGFTTVVGSTTTSKGSLPVGGALANGWYFATVTNPDGTSAFQFYYVKTYGSHAFRLDFGWKVWVNSG